ncbi:MAG TPA: hypothetical protein VGI90_09855 [Steroidobacteraceae bacterium]
MSICDKEIRRATRRMTGRKLRALFLAACILSGNPIGILLLWWWHWAVGKPSLLELALAEKSFGYGYIGVQRTDEPSHDHQAAQSLSL